MAQNTEYAEPMNGEVLSPEDSGRGGDTVMAHMSLGEIVIPRAFADDPDVMEMLNALFQQNGADLRQYTVGDQANKINPETGYPEFGFLSKIFKSPVFRIAAPLALSVLAPGLGTALGSSILGAGATGAATLGNALIGGGVGALTGGGLKGALTGAVTGGIGANIGSLGDAPLGAGVQGAVRPAEGILGAVRSATGLTNQSIPSIGGLVGGSSSGGGSTFANIAAAAGGINNANALKKIQKQQLGANEQQLDNLESFDPSGVTSDPGYEFNLQQGQKALNNQLGAQGNVFSGRAIQEGLQYNQDYASNAFKDYYNRWLTKTGAKNTLIGQGGDIRANATLGQANNLAQSLANVFKSPVGAYDPNSIRKQLGLVGA